MDETAWDVQAHVEQARRGNEDAARALVRRLYPLVLKIVRAHLPRRTSEEDLVQTVFMRVFAKLDQFSGTVPLEHWVSRIAVNSCLNQLDHERVRPEWRLADLSEEEEEVVHRLASTAEDLPVSQRLAARELVEKLLAPLNTEDRLVVSLLHLEGKSIHEVRALTGWSVALVKVRAFRARQKMKKMLTLLLKEGG